MNILFITRKFPPTKGGMEKVAHELYKHLSEITNVKLIKWAGSNKWLPLVLPYFLFKSWWVLLLKKIDIIYLQDGLLAPLGLASKIFRKPVAITIHGLDITYKNRFYQFLIPKCIAKMDKIICISQATKQECVKRGITKGKITVIPGGVSDEFYMSEDKNKLREKLSRKLKFDLKNKKIILSVGRLVERKGFHWFIENVLPITVKKINEIICLIGGDGPLRGEIENSIKKVKMNKYVKLIGGVDEETLKLLYNSSDVFVMPNIPVESDMEGFGIVVLEAASCGVPVVASRLEGIKDAIKNGENGFLIEPCDVDRFADMISRLLKNDYKRKKAGEKARESTMKNYSWEKISEKYLNEFKKGEKK